MNGKINVPNDNVLVLCHTRKTDCIITPLSYIILRVAVVTERLDDFSWNAILVYKFRFSWKLLKFFLILFRTYREYRTIHRKYFSGSLTWNKKHNKMYWQIIHIQFSQFS